MTTKIIRGLSNLTPQQQGTVLAIGNFDGMHKGHQALIKQLKETASALHLSTGIVLFEPQPAEFFSHDDLSMLRIMRFREKFIALNEQGIDYIFLFPFNEKIASLSAEQFIKEIIVNYLSPAKILTGEHIRCGKENISYDHFKELSAKYDLSIEKIPPVMLNSIVISSSQVRASLTQANFSLTDQLLGKPYTIIGRVTHGDKLGRKLGFPTANIFLQGAVNPVKGIYIVRAHGLNDKGWPGVANIGTRPAVHGTRMLLEVYLFEFEREIYGKRLSVEFCKKLRNEEYFPSLELLREQIAKDVNVAREFFLKTGELKKS